jgi:hypothetical protein
VAKEAQAKSVIRTALTSLGAIEKKKKAKAPATVEGLQRSPRINTSLDGQKGKQAAEACI